MVVLAIKFNEPNKLRQTRARALHCANEWIERERASEQARECIGKVDDADGDADADYDDRIAFTFVYQNKYGCVSVYVLCSIKIVENCGKVLRDDVCTGAITQNHSV